jgi:hypothetical protein
MSEVEGRGLDFSKCQVLTAEKCCASTSSISLVCREAKKRKEEDIEKVFLSSRKRKYPTKTEKPRPLPKRCFAQNCFPKIMTKANSLLSRK